MGWSSRRLLAERSMSQAQSTRGIPALIIGFARQPAASCSLTEQYVTLASFGVPHGHHPRAKKRAKILTYRYGAIIWRKNTAAAVAAGVFFDIWPNIHVGLVFQIGLVYPCMRLCSAHSCPMLRHAKFTMITIRIQAQAAK